MNSTTWTRRWRRLSMAATVFLTLILSGGCASLWRPVGGELKTPGWSLSVPAGWMLFETGSYDMLSKDGPYLEYILVQETPLSQGFRFTRQRLTADLLPHEMARIVIDNLSADPQVSDFRLIDSAPAVVGGRPGFKLVYTYQDRYDVPMKTVYYGTVNATHFIQLRFTAARRHYFAASLDDFQSLCQSFKLLAPASS